MKVDKEVLEFLKKIKKNNNREWFKEHKPQFDALKSEVEIFYQSIKDGLSEEDEIEKLKVYRIYRDIRFSKDKTPYKSHFAGSFSRSGKSLRGGYYLRISPGESFLAGGFWGPNKEDLFRIRKEFEISDVEIREILAAPDFKKYFNGRLEGNELKTAPKGFQKDDPAIDLIRKKAFIAIRKFTDQEVLALEFKDEVIRSFRALRPYFDYMSEVLTTDLNGVSIID
ncbi:MAG: DUF2461 domain-containing protein [Flavobacteriaceae bacterium]|nr:MAG: DUF2461 domain-containing protein [Flavobacteriaceae bacterium]